MSNFISHNHDKVLWAMIVPLFFEQLLMLLVGLMDTFVVSFVSEAAVSGVSLVNQFNTVFQFLFTALASGGAVVISQYIGHGDCENSVKSSSQLLLFSISFSLIIAAVTLIFKYHILRLLFGKVEPDVMEACEIYLRISAYSYPALAVYNAGASLFRSIGKTRVTMYISFISNVINIIGNLIGVFVLKAGVAGVAYPSLIARTFSAVLITILCFQKRYEAHYTKKWLLQFDSSMLRTILRIAVPNGVENFIFQFVKIGLSSVVALFGTCQIAANGVAQSFWSIAAVMSLSLQPVYTTVIGQCMGAGDTNQAEAYFHKLNKMTVELSVGWNLLVLAFTPAILHFFALSQQTKQLVFILVIIHNLFNGFAFPFFGPLGFGLRAAGDVKYTMVVAILSTVLVRLLLSIVFAIGFRLGVIGIAIAMGLDWMFRGIVYYERMCSQKWKYCKVI